VEWLWLYRPGVLWREKRFSKSEVISKRRIYVFNPYLT